MRSFTQTISIYRLASAPWFKIRTLDFGLKCVWICHKTVSDSSFLCKRQNESGIENIRVAHVNADILLLKRPLSQVYMFVNIL